MNLLTAPSSVVLWQDMIKHAEQSCDITLNHEIEAYLVTLLIRYANKPEIAKQLIATAFMHAMQHRENQRQFMLQVVGDQCLLFAGLFPQFAEKRNVSVGYFVDLGRSAYSNISSKTNDLYSLLARQFVLLMDILQSLNQNATLLPLQAYDQWQELGSQRSLKILQAYTQGLPFKQDRR